MLKLGHVVVLRAGLKELRYRARILHQDISGSNIMAKMVEKEPHVVIIDFDLAAYVRIHGSRAGQTALHRTGTLPFMSKDVIDSSLDPGSKRYAEFQRRLWHGLESIFYLAIWWPVSVPVATDPAKRKEQKQALADWSVRNGSQVSSTKASFLSNKDEINRVRFTKQFENESLRSTLDKLRVLFNEVYQAPHFTSNESGELENPETLDGKISYGMFTRVLGLADELPNTSYLFLPQPPSSTNHVTTDRSPSPSRLRQQTHLPPFAIPPSSASTCDICIVPASA